MVANRRVLDAEEVFLRATRPTAVAKRLEVLLGTTGDPGFAHGVADEGAATARRRADEIGALRIQLATIYPTKSINKTVKMSRSLI